MKALKIFVLALVSCFFFMSQAQAQFLVKRVKCTDPSAFLPGNGTPDTIVHKNNSGSTKSLAIQITRDSCRPKTSSAHFDLYEASSSAWYSAVAMERTLSYPESTVLEILSGRFAVVRLTPGTSGRVSGTFDYMYSWK